MYTTYTHTTNYFSLLFWVVSMTLVHLGDIAEHCCGLFSHHTVFARDLYSTTKNPRLQEQVLEHYY